MKIITRYISYTILGSTFVVLVVLIALFSFFTYFTELKSTGQGNYDAIRALYYVFLTLPRQAYELIPTASLIGVSIGLGLLSSSSELVAIRSAGVSIGSIVVIVLKAGLFVMLVSLLLGEVITPKTEQYAQMVRSVAISKQLSLEGDQGLWARDGMDIINIRKVLGSGHLGEIYIYHLGKQLQLEKVRYAKSADYQSDQWRLREVNTTVFAEDRVHSEYQHETNWSTSLSPDLLQTVSFKTNTQSTLDLYNYIKYLEANDVSADTYKQAFWNKVAVPLVTGVMVLLAIPFVFGPLRSVGIGQRILVAVLVGVGFYIINLTFSHVGIVYQLNPALSALLPTVLAFVYALYSLRRVK